MSGTSYSDAEMALTAQIAYLDMYEGETVGEAISRIREDYKDKPGINASQEQMLKVADQIEELAANGGVEGYENWKAIAVRDDNDNTGFYGCMIETGEGDAVLSFRGTEPVDSDHLIKDGIADLGLWNSKETRQQAQAAEFANDMYQKYGNKYDAYYMAGHSLGGNLAEHAAVFAPEGMNIQRCVSFDGPGFSNDYIIKNSDRIAARKGVIDHYQYSLVGSLLFPLPGTDFMVIDAHSEPGDGYFARHSLTSIIFKGGSVSPGLPDWAALLVGPLTKELEHNPSAILTFAHQFLDKYIFSNSELSFLITLFSGMCGFGISEFIEKSGIGGFISDIRDRIGSFFKDFGSPQFGEFEVNTEYLDTFNEELQRLSVQIGSTREAIEDICNHLSYQARGGNYLKSFIKRECENLHYRSIQTRMLADAAGTCSKYFNESDKEAADRFFSVAKL